MENLKKVKNPKDMNIHYAEAYNTGNLEMLLNLYESKAKIVNETGEEIIGTENIKQELKHFIALQGTITCTNLSTIIFGEIALLQTKWRIQHGDEVTEGISNEVVRKQPDGSWKYIIDRPVSI